MLEACCLRLRSCHWIRRLQICQVFQHEGPTEALLQPASKREILAALLGTLRDTHWARAVGSLPEPGLMLPISMGTALGAGRTVVAQVTGACASWQACHILTARAQCGDWLICIKPLHGKYLSSSGMQ